MKEYKRFTEKGKLFIEDIYKLYEAYWKLAELEDKIENGTLQEIPFMQKGQYGNRWYVYYRKKTGNKNLTWKMYYSKAEAEKKLKELKGEV